MKKVIIFDLDGVLVFTDRFHYQAWKQMADSMNIYFDEEINHRLRGISRMESLEIILERYDGTFTQEEKQRLAEQKNEIYRKLLAQMTPEDVSEEVRSTLLALKEQGYRLAIGSSSRNTKYILEKTNLSQYFEAVSDGTNITKSKPDPEVFLKAAQYLDEAPERCVVVEDAHAGIDAAKAAGMFAIGIGDAAAYEKTDAAIRSFKELVEIVGGE